MSKTPHITYTAVANACVEILKQGEQPSIRAIHARTGGSYSTITAMFKQWKTATQAGSDAAVSFSDRFKDALRLEVNQITKTIREQLSRQAEQDQRLGHETSQLLAEYEQRIDELSHQLENLKSQCDDQRVAYERKLAVVTEQTHQAQAKLNHLQDQFTSVSESHQKCQIDLAIYQERCAQQDR